MFFDIIYNKANNQIIEIKSFHSNISASSTSDLHGLFDAYNANGIECGFLPWSEGVPNDALINPNDYHVVFAPGYPKPLNIIHAKSGEMFSLNTPTKITDKKIVWFGSFLDYISYSNITRDAAFYLAKKGYNMGFFSTKPSGCVEISEEDQNFYEKYKITQEQSFDPNVLKVISYVPLSKTPKSTVNVAYSLVESFSVSDHILQTFEHYYTELWTATEYSKKIYQEKIGDHINIEVMPLWADENKFKPNPQPYDCKFEIVNENKEDYPSVPTGYKFLNIARYTYRKGFDALLTAYIEEFNKTQDDVSLVLFCRHILNVSNSKEVVMKELRDIVKRTGVSSRQIPPIYIHLDPVHESHQAEMYGWADCFVYPSRGEGFGLPVIEAGLSRIPVLASNHTGLSDFVSDEVALTIGVDKLEKCGTFKPNPETQQFEYHGVEGWRNYATPFYLNQDFQKMGRQSIEEIKEKMRLLYGGFDMSEKIDKFYNLIYDKYTFSKCISKIEKRINEMLKESK